MTKCYGAKHAVALRIAPLFGLNDVVEITDNPPVTQEGLSRRIRRTLPEINTVSGTFPGGAPDRLSLDPALYSSTD
jgi:hypothetical protein